VLPDTDTCDGRYISDAYKLYLG